MKSVKGRKGFDVDLAAGFGEREEVQAGERNDGFLFGNQ